MIEKFILCFFLGGLMSLLIYFWYLDIVITGENAVSMSFKKFEALYTMNPQKWSISELSVVYKARIVLDNWPDYEEISICWVNYEKIPICFNFADSLRYKHWYKKKERENNELTKVAIECWKKDIDEFARREML